MARAVLFNLTPARWAIPDQRWTRPLRKRGWLCKGCRSPSQEMVRQCTAALLIEQPERKLVSDMLGPFEVIHHKLLTAADFSRWRHGRVPCWVSMPPATYVREPDWCQKINFDAFFCTAESKVRWAFDVDQEVSRCEACGQPRYGPGGEPGDKLIVTQDQADAPMWMAMNGWTLFSEPVANAIQPVLGRRYSAERFEIVFE
ncbi:MAG: hypothetical protein NCW75_05445 [Phycisphaera sp.]|nr:MAG: hypothetical protein NCW75_05445 [Phycisphaera sp.]